MSERSQQALKSHKHQQLASKSPTAPPEQPQNDPPTQSPSIKSTHNSISVPTIQNRSVSSEPLVVVGSAWLNGHYLRHASSFRVVQKVGPHHGATPGGLEQCNEYTVMDQAGNKVFFVDEESIACCSLCCFENRPFTLIVKDNLGTSAFVMDRGLVCSCCCGLDMLTVVQTPSGRLLGTVKEEFALLRPVLAIENAAGVKVLRIVGPRWPSSCCGNQVVFRVQNLQGLTVGTISKESVGHTDTVQMSFPSDLDPATKAVCVGALFLIDYEYLEWTRTTKRHKRDQKATEKVLLPPQHTLNYQNSLRTS